MNVEETAIAFACAGDTLLGIVSRPEVPGDLGLIIVVGGPQYRAGSHRQFVRQARAAAASGVAALRFDVRGMGDSEGAQRSFEDITADIGAAINALALAVPSVRRIALWGLCDGASAAMLYLDETHDARVVGLCALNPWVRSEAGQAKTQLRYYYLRRLTSRGFWQKLLRGRVGIAALSELLQKVRLVSRPGSSATLAQPQSLAYPERMARGCKALRDGELMFVLSGNDYTAKEFLVHAQGTAGWANVLSARGTVRRDIRDADHTFSTLASEERLWEATTGWLARMNLRTAADAASPGAAP